MINIMKKTTLLFSVLFTSQILYAQTTNYSILPVEPVKQSKFSMGIKGGFGHSFIMPYRNYKFNPAGNFGISMVISQWEHWGIGMDVIYSTEGATFYSSEMDYTTSLDYIRLPLKAIYFLNTYKNDFRPKLTLGPTFGFLTHESNGTNAVKFDAGANASLGFSYRLIRAVWLSIDANYYQGLTTIYSSTTEKNTNGNARLDIGISFGF